MERKKERKKDRKRENRITTDKLNYKHEKERNKEVRIRTEIKRVRELNRRARGKCVFYRPVCIISGILIKII